MTCPAPPLSLAPWLAALLLLLVTAMLFVWELRREYRRLCAKDDALLKLTMWRDPT